jgi:hypothetical protein
LRIKQQVHGCDALETAASLQDLGGLCERQGRVSEAESYFKEALRIQELKVGEAGIIGAASTRNKLSELHPPPLAHI